MRYVFRYAAVASYVGEESGRGETQARGSMIEYVDRRAAI